MNAKQIKEAIENNRSEYEYFGLRAVTRNPITNKYELLKVGDVPSNSYDWDDGSPTDFELRGTSALAIDMDAEAEDIEAVIKNLRAYDHGAQIVLLGSRYKEWGTDENEILMYGRTTVLAEWRK